VALDVTTNKAAVALSVVAPCYNDQECLPEFHRRVGDACRAAVGGDYEIVLVDDGSTDATRQIVQALSQADRRVIGVHLMRNHGHQLAATAGLSVARGQRILLIDADLQENIRRHLLPAGPSARCPRWCVSPAKVTGPATPSLASYREIARRIERRV
jgi:glycosyltransferase involved in cell wall biosynthesis